MLSEADSEVRFQYNAVKQEKHFNCALHCIMQIIEVDCYDMFEANIKYLR